MKPVPLQPDLPTPTTAFGNPAPITQYYICPHCNKQSPLVREWGGLTDEEVERLIHNFGSDPHTLLDEVNARLQKRNT